jgi:hypothetical protein
MESGQQHRPRNSANHRKEFIMSRDRLVRRSEFFTVRLWPEELGEGEVEWRGRVQHAVSGRTGYFRDWSGLIVFFAEILGAQKARSDVGIET